MKTTNERKIKTYPFDFIFRTMENGKIIATVEIEDEWGASGEMCDTEEQAIATAIINASEFDDISDMIYPVLAHDIVRDKRAFINYLRK